MNYGRLVNLTSTSHLSDCGGKTRRQWAREAICDRWMMHDMQMQKDSFFCQKTCQSGCEHHGETRFYLKISSKTKKFSWDGITWCSHPWCSKDDLSKSSDKCMGKSLCMYACMHECMIMFKFGENMVGWSSKSRSHGWTRCPVKLGLWIMVTGF